jgi:16S rRNA (adenine1518-N6/adenine1519-N6)-dimethyltransferase
MRKTSHRTTHPNSVRAKKHLGQHFLRDENIALKIVESLVHTDLYKKVLEVGPGMGVLTKYLLQETSYETSVIEIDRESIAYLKKNFPALTDRIIEADFLRLDFSATLGTTPFAVIGNFPYNISSQILFKVLEHKEQVPEVVGMFQKEVAERIAAPPGNKTYGILSVLLQAYYDIEYLFTVHENVFSPPPKVKSAVIRLVRNQVQSLECDEVLLKKTVKAGFNQRRKTLRNALKQLMIERNADATQVPFLDKRAEQLSVADFVTLTRSLQE